MRSIYRGPVWHNVGNTRQQQRQTLACAVTKTPRIPFYHEDRPSRYRERGCHDKDFLMGIPNMNRYGGVFILKRPPVFDSSFGNVDLGVSQKSML